MRGTPVALDVRGLDVALGGRAVLQAVSFALAPGAFCAVVGPNGSGKTTLVRALYRSLEPRAGQILLDGDPQAGLSRNEIARRVAVLRQEPDLAFEFSVRELVEMGRSPYRGLLEASRSEDTAVVQDCLRICDVDGLADRDFSSLSGGEKQRVLLARALAQAPGLLLLDEPTNHLDVFHQLDILGRVGKMGCTVVAAVHALDLAERFADHVLVLQEGRVEAFGPPAEVLTAARVRAVFGVSGQRLEAGDARAWAFDLPGAQ